MANFEAGNSVTDKINCTGLGTSMADIFASKWATYVTPLIPSRKDIVLFTQPVTLAQIPKPNIVEVEDSIAVAELPVKNHHKKHREKCGEIWAKILKNLKEPVKNERDLRNIIAENIETCPTDFSGIRYYFDKMSYSKPLVASFDINSIFKDIVPGIIKLALSLPEEFPSPLPCLVQGCPMSVSISQKQAAVILANAFLCTFPTLYDRYSYPSINFNGLWYSSNSAVMNKIHCIMHYFKRVVEKMPVGVITFQRKVITYDNFPDWGNSKVKISTIKLHVNRKGTIEDQGIGCLQVDFANKYIGGGVLNTGCVQEEIRFAICPELIVSRLFVQSLKDNEALLITGCERYCNYKGYGRNFQYSSEHEDTTPHDAYGRRRTSIVAIDAQDFTDPSRQYEYKFIKRELNKAYVGFYEDAPETATLSPVATGNWGCGVFNGNRQLKALLQIMACAVAKRNIIYYTFGNASFQSNLHEIFGLLVRKDVTVGKLFKVLLSYKDSDYYKSDKTVFDYVKFKLQETPIVPEATEKPENSKTNSFKPNKRKSSMTAEDYNIFANTFNSSKSASAMTSQNKKDFSITSEYEQSLVDSVNNDENMETFSIVTNVSDMFVDDDKKEFSAVSDDSEPFVNALDLNNTDTSMASEDIYVDAVDSEMKDLTTSSQNSDIFVNSLDRNKKECTESVSEHSTSVDTTNITQTIPNEPMAENVNPKQSKITDFFKKSIV